MSVSEINVNDFLMEIYNRIPSKNGTTDTYSYTFYLGERWSGPNRYPEIVYKKTPFAGVKMLPYQTYGSIEFEYRKIVLHDRAKNTIPYIGYALQSGFDSMVDNIMQELCSEKNIPLIRPMGDDNSKWKYIRPKYSKLYQFYDNLFKGEINRLNMVDLSRVSGREIDRAYEIVFDKYINTSDIVSIMKSVFQEKIQKLKYSKLDVDFEKNVIKLQTPFFPGHLLRNEKDVDLPCRALVQASIEMANILKMKRIEILYNRETDRGYNDPRNCAASKFGKIMGEILKNHRFHLYTEKGGYSLDYWAIKDI